MSLGDIIARHIRKHGPITFRRYMEMALYHEKFGYYSGYAFPGGEKGDFLTAPQAGRLFGYLLANQIREFMNHIDHEPFTIVEMGAGSGAMASDILGSLASSSPVKYRYAIIEPRRRARDLQKDTLADFMHHVLWVDSLRELGPFFGCVVSNELLDAFPVTVVQKGESGVSEIFVDTDESGVFSEVSGAISDSFVSQYCERYLNNLPVPYRTEINREMRDWVFEIADFMETGFILTVDYGYTRDEYLLPHRNRGTLMGYYQNQPVDDVLQYPGLIDITCHVNFSDLHEWGREAGFETCGYTRQNAFLAGLDFEDTFQRLYGKVDPFSPGLAAVKTLIMPGAMGESHKVMIQRKNISVDVDLSGFRFSNNLKAL